MKSTEAKANHDLKKKKLHGRRPRPTKSQTPKTKSNKKFKAQCSTQWNIKTKERPHEKSKPKKQQMTNSKQKTRYNDG
jgi:hypothetical protein